MQNPNLNFFSYLWLFFFSLIFFISFLSAVINQTHKPAIRLDLRVSTNWLPSLPHVPSPYPPLWHIIRVKYRSNMCVFPVFILAAGIHGFGSPLEMHFGIFVYLRIKEKEKKKLILCSLSPTPNTYYKRGFERHQEYRRQTKTSL